MAQPRVLTFQGLNDSEMAAEVEHERRLQALRQAEMERALPFDAAFDKAIDAAAMRASMNDEMNELYCNPGILIARIQRFYDEDCDTMKTSLLEDGYLTHKQKYYALRYLKTEMNYGYFGGVIKTSKKNEDPTIVIRNYKYYWRVFIQNNESFTALRREFESKHNNNNTKYKPHE